VNPRQRSSLPRPVASSTAERIASIIEAAERAASAVIDDAEAQARKYLEEAQTEADRIVSERLASLSGLTDSLVTQAEAIRHQSDRLLSSLDEAGPQLDTEPSSYDEAPVAAPAEAVAPDLPAAEAAVVEPEPAAASAQAAPVEPPAPPPPVAPPEPAAPPEPVAPPPAAAEVPPPAPRLSAVAPPVGAPVEQPPVAAAPPAPTPAVEDPGHSAGARLLATQMAVSGSSRAEIETRLRSGFDIENTAPILDAILGPEF
jgi:hypothetical protein